jgi:Transposase and inactivated derivatives
MHRSGRVADRLVVKNTPESITQFLDRLPHGVRFIGSEATGPYHTHLAEACLDHGITFKLLNPLVTKQFTRATIRKRKTDEDDAVYIGRSLLLERGRTLSAADFSPALPHLRTATDLVNMAATLKQRRGRFFRYVRFSTEAQYHLTTAEDALRAAADALRHIGALHVDEKSRELLQSIPGIGATLAATIAAEIGDINRFSNGKALVAYAGLDPRVRQSGTSLIRNTHLTKRGSPHLRHALFLAAAIGQRHDASLKEHYAKKRAEGDCFTAATVANARRMAHRVFAILKRKTPYEVRPTILLST